MATKSQSNNDTVQHAEESSNKILAQSLDGLKFPATRDQIVEHAKSNSADDQTIAVLSAMPSKGQYEKMPDVFVNAAGVRSRLQTEGASATR